MALFIVYFLKVNIALAIFYILYKLAFTKDTFLNLKRYLLLFICIISLVYPFIEITTIKENSDTINLFPNIYNALLPELTIDGETTANSVKTIEWFGIAGIIYLIGTLLFFFRSLMEIGNTIIKIFSGKKSIIHGVRVYEMDSQTEPYSFFRWICIPAFRSYEQKELEEILIHEEAHAQELHSLDVILIQFILILNWFNPFVWLLRNEIRINHEYLADRKVINAGYNKKSYQYHLIGFTQTIQFKTAGVCNNFSILPLKSRLKMLNKKDSPNILLGKYLILIPAVLLLLVFNNCQNGDYELLGFDNNKVEMIPVQEDNAETTVFEIVEKMPEFPGGQIALMQYLSNSIRYPVTEQENGVQGRVIVQFVVNKDGSISSPVVVRGVSEFLDKEALRVIHQMPKWIPGMQRNQPVNVKYTVPIVFRLQ